MEDLIGILVAVGIIVFKIWTGMKGETKEAVPTTTSQLRVDSRESCYEAI